MERISRKEYQSWLGDFVTRAVRKVLYERVDSIKSMWALGNFENDEITDARHRGMIEGMMLIEQLDNFFEEGGSE